MTTPRPISKNLGFTLIETIIVVALSAIMLGVISLLAYNFYTSSAYQQALTDSSGSANAFARELESLVVPANAVLQTHTFSGVAYTSSPTTLVLEIPSIDDSGNIIANTHDYAVFYTTGTDAYRILEADPASARVSGTKKISSVIYALTFSYDSVDFTLVRAVTTDIQTRTTLNGTAISSHTNEQISLRNH